MPFARAREFGPRANASMGSSLSRYSREQRWQIAPVRVHRTLAQAVRAISQPLEISLIVPGFRNMNAALAS